MKKAWKIKFVLKSGREIVVKYYGNEKTCNEVADKILSVNENSFSGFNSEDDTGNVLIKMREIESITINY